jgi:hypothetical protein
MSKKDLFLKFLSLAIMMISACLLLDFIAQRGIYLASLNDGVNKSDIQLPGNFILAAGLILQLTGGILLLDRRKFSRVCFAVGSAVVLAENIIFDNTSLLYFGVIFYTSALVFMFSKFSEKYWAIELE